MEFKVDGTTLPVYPSNFKPALMDLDNAETTERTLDGVLNRDRIAVKRQLELTFGAMTGTDLATILQMFSNVWVEFTYPDPLTRQNETRTFYAGNRSAAVAIAKDNEIWWTGLQFTLTER